MSDGNQMLKENLEIQLERLQKELEDLEECRNDMTDEEYNESKKDTHEQLDEFLERLNKMNAGDISVLDRASFIHLASVATLAKVCKPSHIKTVKSNKSNILKEKLHEIERNIKSGKLSLEIGNRQKFEVLTSLLNLGYELSDSEKIFIREETNKFQNNSSSNGFNIPDTINGLDFNEYLKIDDNIK